MPRAENPAQHPVGAGIRPHQTADAEARAAHCRVTIAQLAGDEPLETEPDQTDAVSDLIRDEPIAAYENLKRYLTEEDKADIATLIRLRAEINQGKQ